MTVTRVAADAVVGPVLVVAERKPAADISKTGAQPSGPNASPRFGYSLSPLPDSNHLTPSPKSSVAENDLQASETASRGTRGENADE